MNLKLTVPLSFPETPHLTTVGQSPAPSHHQRRQQLPGQRSRKSQVLMPSACLSEFQSIYCDETKSFLTSLFLFQISGALVARQMKGNNFR